ncbi:hypothetical protein LXL04_014223 [Taraxacum kok-saghyz]
MLAVCRGSYHMGYKYKNDEGDIPGYGAIFMSNSGTKKECFQRKLLGLPLSQSNFVLHVKKGMILFLFEFERRQLHGVFRATSNGEIDIEPNAFKSSGKLFPAQVRFTPVWSCTPLAEYEFQDAIRDNYYSGKKFKFGLSKDQVYNLVKLFHSKRIPKTHPERTLRQYDDKESEGDSRFHDNMKNIRDRVRFVKQEYSHDGFHTDETKQVDIDGYRTHKDNRERVLQDFCERDTRQQLEKHFNHENRIQDEYHSINNFSQSLSSHNIDRGSQMVEYGEGYFGHDTLEREERTLCKPEGTTDVWRNMNPSYEPRLSPYEQRGIDISHFNQSSDFIPISEYQHPFEFDTIGKTNSNTYEYGFPYDHSVIPIDSHTPYNPEVPEFCHKSSYFTPGPCSSPISNRPEKAPYHSEKKHSDADKFRSSYVRKASVFDRLTSVPKPVKHEQKGEKDDVELDASVDTVMKMLEKIVSSPIKRPGKKQSIFKRQYPLIKQDDNKSEIVNHDFPNIKENEKIEGESVIEETRVVDFKRRKKTNKKFDDESKEVGTESDVGKRRKLVRPVFVKKESTVKSEESTPLKADCCLTKADESLEKFEGQKSGTQGEVCPQVEENGKADCCLTKADESLEKIQGQKSGTQEEVCSQVEENGNEESCKVMEKQPQEKHGSDDVGQVQSSKDASKMCGWIEG